MVKKVRLELIVQAHLWRVTPFHLTLRRDESWRSTRPIPMWRSNPCRCEMANKRKQMCNPPLTVIIIPFLVPNDLQGFWNRRFSSLSFTTQHDHIQWQESGKPTTYLSNSAAVSHEHDSIPLIPWEVVTFHGLFAVLIIRKVGEVHVDGSTQLNLLNKWYIPGLVKSWAAAWRSQHSTL